MHGDAPRQPLANRKDCGASCRIQARRSFHAIPSIRMGV
jgi:hypothetical protein